MYNFFIAVRVSTAAKWVSDNKYTNDSRQPFTETLYLIFAPANLNVFDAEQYFSMDNSVARFAFSKSIFPKRRK